MKILSAKSETCNNGYVDSYVKVRHRLYHWEI